MNETNDWNKAVRQIDEERFGLQVAKLFGLIIMFGGLYISFTMFFVATAIALVLYGWASENHNKRNRKSTTRKLVLENEVEQIANRPKPVFFIGGIFGG